MFLFISCDIKGRGYPLSLEVHRHSRNFSLLELKEYNVAHKPVWTVWQTTILRADSTAVGPCLTEFWCLFLLVQPLLSAIHVDLSTVHLDKLYYSYIVKITESWSASTGRIRTVVMREGIINIEDREDWAWVAAVYLCVCVCVCVCARVLASSKLLTVLHVVPRWQELCLQFFHLVAPFILHLDQEGMGPIPIKPVNSGARSKHTHSKQNHCSMQNYME